MVADAYQRLGIGRLLLLRLLAAAAARDVRRVRFYSLADNEPLRRLVKRVSERVTFSSEGGVLTGEFDIPAIDATAAARLSNLRVGCNRLARRLLLVLTALAALWSMSPAHASEQRLIDISRPPGKLVNIGTHRLYLYCIGVGSPTVVFDAGLGGSSLEWFTVQQKLAARTRVCAYDRAGYGWSDTGPGPRTSLRNAMELRALLKHAGIDPPYVLAGHSFGGYNMQLFASLYAKSVAGLVLIDSSHAEQVERFEAEPIGVSIAPRRGTAILMSPPVVPENLPAELFGPFAALMSSGKALRASMDELQHFRLSSHQVRSAPRWPDVPVIVLTRGQRVWTGEGKGELMERLWMQLQDELATRNPHSLHIVARASGHHIHLDQPRVVVRAVALILGAELGPVQDRPRWRQTETTWERCSLSHAG